MEISGIVPDKFAIYYCLLLRSKVFIIVNIFGEIMPNQMTAKLIQFFHRYTVVRNLEVFQDFIVISLCLGLFGVMCLRLVDMFSRLLQPLDLRQVTSDILFILILVELFRLLVDYLQERRISVGAAVEISIVSSLREVILQGVLDIPRDSIIAISIFLVVLGGLLIFMPLMTQHFTQIPSVETSVFPENSESLTNSDSQSQH